MISEILSSLVLIIIGGILALIIKYLVDQAYAQNRSYSEQEYQQYQIYNKSTVDSVQIDQQNCVNDTQIDKNDQKSVSAQSNMNEKTIFQQGASKNDQIIEDAQNQLQNNNGQLTGPEKELNEYKVGEELIFEDFKIETQFASNENENDDKNEKIAEMFFEEQIENRIYLNPIMPKQQHNQKTANLIQLLQIPAFGVNNQQKKQYIGKLHNQKEIIQEFANTDKQLALQIKESIQNYQEVNNDENNYFIAVGYQYFLNLLNLQQDEEFFQQLTVIQQENLKIQSKKFLVNSSMTSDIPDELVTFLKQLRLSSDKKNSLKNLINDNSLFYGKFIIYMRNLASKVLLQNQDQYAQYAQEILFWENYCTISGILNQLFADYLDVMVNDFEIDREKGELNVEQYGSNQDKQISLFWNEDHYDICQSII